MNDLLLNDQQQLNVVFDYARIVVFDRARIVNTQRNTIKRKIAESLFIKNHSTVDGNKSSFPLSIFNP